MTSTTLTSELEAINIVLTAVDEAPVSSLSLSGLYPLDQAKAILSETSRVVQSSGWAFNTEPGYTLIRDGSGLITVAGNILQFTTDGGYTDISPILRGSRLYDRKGHTFVFTQNVTGTAVLLLPWEDLPQAARHCITMTAAKTMQGRTSVPESTYRYTQEDLDAAKQVLVDLESVSERANMLTDSWSVYGVIADRDLY